VEAKLAAVKRPPHVPLRGKESPAGDSAKNRALRGFRHAKYKKHAVYFFFFGRDRYAPLQSLAHEPGAAYAEWVLECRPPLNWNLAVPCSGARRATWVTNNTLNVSRAFLGAPLARTFVKPWLAVLLGRNNACWIGRQSHCARTGHAHAVESTERGRHVQNVSGVHSSRSMTN
jgi:hypothetical protein